MEPFCRDRGQGLYQLVRKATGRVGPSYSSPRLRLRQ